MVLVDNHPSGGHHRRLHLIGPQKVKVLKITHDGGIWVEAQGMLGGDAEFDLYQTLADLSAPPLQVPLSVDSPADGAWLTHLRVSSLVYPTTNATFIAGFLKDSWKQGFFAVRADVDNVNVRGGLWNKPSWRTKFHGKLSNDQTSIRVQVPLVPGLPHPGANLPLPTISELVTLESFNVHSSTTILNLEAWATLVDPAPATVQHRHHNLPLLQAPSSPSRPAPSKRSPPSSNTTSLASPTPSSSPSPRPPYSPSPASLSLPSSPHPNPRPHLLQNVTIRDMKLKPTGPNGQFVASGVVEGRLVLPRGMDVGLNVSRILPDVLVFDGEVPGDGDGDSDNASVTTTRWNYREDGYGYEEEEYGYGFPWTGSKGRTPPPPRDPLPDPLPDRAFGHIRPEEWLNAKSVRVDLDEDGDDDGEGDGEGEEMRERKGKRKGKGKEGKEKETGAVYAVTAKVVDVPLEVLPRRQKEFSNFVSKVIFNSDGALAGIQGTAAVGLTVEGLPLFTPPPDSHLGSGEQASSNYLVLAGLPFQGSVRINKRSLFKGEMKGLGRILEEFPFIQCRH
ncbi:hypothetical protein EST38_g13065 [Candolleomyces aberdarensis]|uniref:Uncharacterized protein n=1 Tax=Candolleomyces aberdarensis TaxID=2316362 RepID=A0A4Q2D1L4_9AGAR|nr:hypothetical protein EST38_g13065 [Candolleomyces aberdarensis]